MFEMLFSWNNLLEAYRKASRGKRSNPSVAAFEYRLEDNLSVLSEELRNHTYQPGKYINFTIHEPKKRLISAASFRDRVVHHALCNVIEPVIEKTFIFDSYANRKGKGTHKALNRCQEFSRKFRYALQCDIEQFFPSIDHDILRSILVNHVADPHVMDLVNLILESGKEVLEKIYRMVLFPGDDLFAFCRPRGLPIGNLTSQFWANVFLNPFDHFVKRELRCKGYLRYVDDFLLFGNTKGELWKQAGMIKKRLERFRLTMHPPCVRPVREGIPFLGFVVFPDKRLLKRRKVVHFKRKYRKMRLAWISGEITGDRFGESVQSWNNHARFCNACALRESLLSESFLIGKIHERRNFIVLKEFHPKNGSGIPVTKPTVT